MRPLRKITEQEENFRVVDVAERFSVIRFDYVEPEPVGTIVLLPYRIAGYTPDADGSALATLEPLYYDKDTDALESNGDAIPNNFLDASGAIVVDESELKPLLNPL